MANDYALDPSTKRKQLQEDFVDNVTLHGYRHLFISSKKRRCIWWVFFLGAIVFAVWLFYGAVSDFFEYKTYTTIEYDHTIEGAPFPSLTLCYHQPYTRRRIPLKNHNNFTDLIFRNIFDKRSQFGNLSTEVLNLLEDIEAKGIDSYEKLVKLFSIDINNTLNSKITKAFLHDNCRFNRYKCLHDDFKVINNYYDDSPCYQYNYYSKDRAGKTQVRPKKDFWLEVYFNLHDEDALGVDMKGKGMTLYVHDRKTPHHEEFNIDVTLQPGVLTTVTFEELRTMKFLPPVYGDCGTQQYRVIKDFPYSYSMCKLDCKMEARVKTCGCVGYTYKEYVKDDIKICSIMQIVKCSTDVDVEILQSVRECVSTCLQECTQNKYPVRVGIASLQSDKHTYLVKKYTGWNKTDEEVDRYIKKNIVGVKVGFSNIVQRNEISTPSVTIASLLGTIGGSIGLGLGFSVLTFVEFLLFFMDYIYLCFPCADRQISDKPV